MSIPLQRRLGFAMDPAKTAAVRDLTRNHAEVIDSRNARNSSTVAHSPQARHAALHRHAYAHRRGQTCAIGLPAPVHPQFSMGLSLMVVRTSRCLSSPCIARESSPSSPRGVAKECRGVFRNGTYDTNGAVSRFLFTVTCLVIGHSGPPLRWDAKLMRVKIHRALIG